MVPIRLLDINFTSLLHKKRSKMQAEFSTIGRFGWSNEFKLIALTCVIFSIKTLYESDKNGYFHTAAKEIRNRIHNRAPPISSITLFVRMASKLKQHRTRFYCDFFRTAVLFWPASFGKTVVVLDEESDQDHIFANNLTNQIKQHFPHRKLEVAPEDVSILNFTASKKSPGYNRQLWSSFFIDLYTNDPTIAWIDSDVAFLTPVTKSNHI